jgi:1,4-dihydroxy-2-naphthoyl-CoA hydrolase
VSRVGRFGGTTAGAAECHRAFRLGALPWAAVTAPPTAFDELAGLELVAMDAETVSARVEVRDELRQPAGLIHGGVYAAIAESICSTATDAVVSEHGRTAQGLSSQTSFLRPITAGTIHATARRRHGGRTTWVWEMDVTDDEGRLCALVRMAVAVRELSRGSGS